MDAREQKARKIVAGGKITFAHGYWLVPSQSGGARPKVEVDGLFPSCSCKDFELRGKDCKHILAVRLFKEQQKAGKQPQPVAPQEPPPKVKRPTYRQDWPNYDLAQTREKDHVQELLAELCQGIQQPPLKNPKKGGCPPVLLSDATLAVVLKVYSTISTRRFIPDLRTAHGDGHLAQSLCYRSVIKALENKALTPILKDLSRLSSLPLAQVETTFAPDSTGFCTSKFIRWFDVKYGVTREEAYWVKAHLMTGTKTNVVTAVEIEDRHAADSPQFVKLRKATTQGFKIKEVSADMAYTSTENLQAVADLGGTLSSPFRKNTTGGIGGIFEKAFHFFCLKRDEFLPHYHQRSNVESTISMIKRKFGDAVRAKSDVAMVNVVLAKVVCHNVCCLVSAMYELGIVPVFWPNDDEGNPAILPMMRPG